MIKTVTLQEAISEAFGIKNVPSFPSYKPVKQAREWLDKQELPYEYNKGQLKAGVVIYAFGAGNPLYSVNDGEDTDRFKGAMIFATLSPKYKSKSEQRRREVLEQEKASAEPTETPVEEAPSVENAPEDQSEPQTTVTEADEQPKPRRRRSSRRRSK